MKTRKAHIAHVPAEEGMLISLTTSKEIGSEEDMCRTGTATDIDSFLKVQVNKSSLPNGNSRDIPTYFDTGREGGKIQLAILSKRPDVMATGKLAKKGHHLRCEGKIGTIT